MRKSADGESDLSLIQRLMNRYMQAVDVVDIDTLRNVVFTADGMVELGTLISVREFCEALLSMSSRKIRTQHFLTNTVTDVDGDTAFSKTYFVGYHRLPAGQLGPDMIAMFGAGESERDVTIGGFTEDRLIKHERDWKISRRRIVPVWRTAGTPAELLNPGWLI